MPDTFLFYDLETFGQDPRRTRIAQFAAVRTDAQLQVVEEPDTPVSRLHAMVAKMDDRQAEEVLDILSGKRSVKPDSAARSEAVVESAKRWLIIDYEIVSDALDIEINPEMSPLVVRKIIDSALNRMGDEAKRDIPEMVWQFVESIREVFPNVSQGEPGRVALREIRDSVVVVECSEPASSFLSRIRESQRWMSWIDSNGVRFWQDSNGTVMFESPNFRGLEPAFVQAVIESFELAATI